jgi:hypothetical protein
MSILESVTIDHCRRCPVTTGVAVLALALTSMWHLEVPIDWAFLNADIWGQ